ncbi:MerR family transcriptional regulator [Clostridium estertheticum]|uniref:MerR family transcriptional regulator n=1 Tax=Clostridium estertheticum subsp. estertheticum TaxID=1552 RepID=A0A1J0GFF4_9CLOT|nr:MerR family transcriptional regulator [Clostridium estertheticum]APC40106.1 MerR family transcriptional regulator [Clostridium estertheticum subsp. estertheticum]MBZ9618113.1 MerR family transcriptional regulator [Clostridium estertheticum subsp. laramiense]WAG73766.1 MerR family transcriptional regulator [Clostridium estertheticum]
MKTIKQVSDLTGISVRMLHYYDKIGLLKPSNFTDSGYRLYDDEALETLQQILFFKELDIPLKEVKEIMASAHFDKMQSLKSHEKLLILKRNRLNGLIELVNKTLRGENTMSFKEFDMSEYYNALEGFKTKHKDIIIKSWGNIDKYDEFIETCKSKETEIAKMAIKEYGSIKKYVESMKKNFNSDAMTKADQIDDFKKDCLYDRHPKLKELYKKLTEGLSKNPSSVEIQDIAGEITGIAKRDYEVFKNELGDYYWNIMVKLLLEFPKGLEKNYDGRGMSWIESMDKKYGEGSSKFMGKALKIYLGDYEPKIETLYKKLGSDLSKDTTSKEIQQIVSEIVNENRKMNEYLKFDEGENHWGYTAELYLSNPMYIKVMDKKYGGSGASKFIGEALKFYAENNK